MLGSLWALLRFGANDNDDEVRDRIKLYSSSAAEMESNLWV